jgi:hypothetical protein
MRQIKFRVWDSKIPMMLSCRDIAVAIKLSGEIRTLNIEASSPTLLAYNRNDVSDRYTLMQFTGLLDKNGLTEIYEGDIISPEGLLRGNIHESPQVYREGIDCVIAGMGTEAWRGSESIAMGRGCKYTK